MAKFNVVDINNKPTSDSLTITDKVLSEGALSLVIRRAQSNSRNTVAHTLEKGEVSGSNKKPWKQKGTGRARVGNKRNPVWRGGGIVFGPRSNRNFSTKMNKKIRSKSLLSILASQKDNVIVVNDLSIASGKTKDASVAVNNFSTNKVNIIDVNLKGLVAYKNISNARLHSLSNIDYSKLISDNKIIISKSALEILINGAPKAEVKKISKSKAVKKDSDKVTKTESKPEVKIEAKKPKEVKETK